MKNSGVIQNTQIRGAQTWVHKPTQSLRGYDIGKIISHYGTTKSSIIRLNSWSSKTKNSPHNPLAPSVLCPSSASGLQDALDSIQQRRDGSSPQLCAVLTSSIKDHQQSKLLALPKEIAGPAQPHLQQLLKGGGETGVTGTLVIKFQSRLRSLGKI